MKLDGFAIIDCRGWFWVVVEHIINQIEVPVRDAYFHSYF